MLLASLTAYARMLFPAVCDNGPAQVLLLLALIGSALLALESATLNQMVHRNRTVALPGHVMRVGRRVVVVLVAMTGVALGLTIALATEPMWYGNGVLLQCGLAMRVGEMDQAAGAGPLAVGMVIGILALLVIGTILTRLVVRQRRLLDATRRAEESSDV